MGLEEGVAEAEPDQNEINRHKGYDLAHEFHLILEELLEKQHI